MTEPAKAVSNPVAADPDGDLFGMCSVCSGEFMALGADSDVCPSCLPVAPMWRGGLL